MSKILIIQLARLGDIIQTKPLIEDIIFSNSNDQVFLLINDLFKDCAYFFPNVEIIPINFESFIRQKENKITVFENKYFLTLLDTLHNLHLDYVINLNNSIISEKILAHFNNIPKIGFKCGNSEWTTYQLSFMKSRILNSLNLVDIFRFLGRNNSAIAALQKTKPQQPPSPLKKNSSKKVALQCGARNQKRQLTLKQYCDIASSYLSLGYEILLLGTIAESNTALQITQTINSQQIINLTGRTNLQQLHDIIGQCERVFTPDTGTMHLAALVNVPITVLFLGPAYPFETLAYTKKAQVIMPNPEYFPCYPCSDDYHCPYHNACHTFNFTKHLNNVGQNEFLYLTVGSDEIGQTLFPLPEGAALWRSFTKLYFFQVQQPFPELSLKLVNQLSRELKLWKSILDHSCLGQYRDNFFYLTPLLYYKTLSPNSILPDQVIAFFQSFLKNKSLKT